MLKKIAITQEIEEIERSISCLDEVYKIILTEKYIKRQKIDLALYQDLDMSEGSFYKALQQALLDFACIFNHGELLQYLDKKHDIITYQQSKKA